MKYHYIAFLATTLCFSQISPSVSMNPDEDGKSASACSINQKYSQVVEGLKTAESADFFLALVCREHRLVPHYKEIEQATQHHVASLCHPSTPHCDDIGDVAEREAQAALKAILEIHQAPAFKGHQTPSPYAAEKEKGKEAAAPALEDFDTFLARAINLGLQHEYENHEDFLKKMNEQYRLTQRYEEAAQQRTEDACGSPASVIVVPDPVVVISVSVVAPPAPGSCPH